MPYLQILQKYGYQGIFACRIDISMKTVQNPTSENIRKSIGKSKRNVFQMEKKTNKEKLAIFKFLRKSALSLIKLEVIMSYLQIL